VCLDGSAPGKRSQTLSKRGGDTALALIGEGRIEQPVEKEKRVLRKPGEPPRRYKKETHNGLLIRGSKGKLPLSKGKKPEKKQELDFNFMRAEYRGREMD